MVKIGHNSPLRISKGASEVIESMRTSKKYKKTAFLRVKAVIPEFNMDAVTFNMYFDEVTEESDMAYSIGPTRVVLDSQTAYLLVGSKLFKQGDGALAFDHMDTSTCFDMNDRPIKN